MDVKEKSTSNSKPKSMVHDFLTCRRILNVMVFLGFMVNYMLRVNLTFAIVDMVMKSSNITKIENETLPILNRTIRSTSNEDFLEDDKPAENIGDAGDVPQMPQIPENENGGGLPEIPDFPGFFINPDGTYNERENIKCKSELLDAFSEGFLKGKDKKENKGDDKDGEANENKEAEENAEAEGNAEAEENAEAEGNAEAEENAGADENSDDKDNGDDLDGDSASSVKKNRVARSISHEHSIPEDKNDTSSDKLFSIFSKGFAVGRNRLTKNESDEEIIEAKKFGIYPEILSLLRNDSLFRNVRSPEEMVSENKADEDQDEKIYSRDFRKQNSLGENFPGNQNDAALTNIQSSLVNNSNNEKVPNVEQTSKTPKGIFMQQNSSTNMNNRKMNMSNFSSGQFSTMQGGTTFSSMSNGANRSKNSGNDRFSFSSSSNGFKTGEMSGNGANGFQQTSGMGSDSTLSKDLDSSGTNLMNEFSSFSKAGQRSDSDADKAKGLMDNNENEKLGTSLNGTEEKKYAVNSGQNLTFGEEKNGDIHTLSMKNKDEEKPSVRNSQLENNDGKQKTDNVNNQIRRDRVKRFNWSEGQQGILIGSFFWGYICTELPGGRLAELIGARKVFGYATLAASVVTLLTPLSAKIHFVGIVIIRVLLGLFLGPTWPSVLPLAAKWIPPDERGKFLSNMMASTLGAGFTLPICGFIISVLSWEYVFYITGLLGFIWSVLWFLLVFDSPATHPRISEEERNYIETKLGIIPAKTAHLSSDEKLATQGLMNSQTRDDLGLSDSGMSDSEQSYKSGDDSNRNYSTFPNGNARNTDQNEKSPSSSPNFERKDPIRKQDNLVNVSREKGLSSSVNSAPQKQSSHAKAPWFHILTSVPVWAFVLTHGASVFGYNTITNQLPTYMKYILKFNIKENGLLSSLPYLGKYVSALVGGSIADRLLRSEKFSRGFVRKLFTTIGVMIPGFLMILQIFWGSDKVLSIFIFTTALTFNGCVTGGYLGNSLDIAPNFSGTVFGLGNMLSGLSGAVSAILVGYLTDHNQVYGQWQKVFFIVALVYVLGALTFLIFGSAEPQPWNYSLELHKKKVEDDTDNEETMILHSNRKRTSTSSLCRSSYTEDDWSGYKDSSNKTRRKRKRRKTKESVSECSFNKSKQTIETDDFSMKPTISGQTYDSDEEVTPVLQRIKTYAEVNSEFEIDIKLRNNDNDENRQLKVKNRSSYKEAIENSLSSSNNNFQNGKNHSNDQSKSDSESNTSIRNFKNKLEQRYSFQEKESSDDLSENKERLKQRQTLIPIKIENENESSNNKLINKNKQKLNYKESNESIEKATDALEMLNESHKRRTNEKDTTNEGIKNEYETEMKNISSDSTKDNIKSLKTEAQRPIEDKKEDKKIQLDGKNEENTRKKRFSLVNVIRQSLSSPDSPT